MKELSIQEKAQLYDEAIERAKKIYGNGITEEISPELKESEDEKIKNAILNHLKKMWGNSQDDVCGVHVEDAIKDMMDNYRNAIDEDDATAEEVKNVLTIFNTL